MGITGIAVERVHRLQRRKEEKDKKPRSIVAKFTFFKDRKRVRKYGKRPEGTNFVCKNNSRMKSRKEGNKRQVTEISEMRKAVSSVDEGHIICRSEKKKRGEKLLIQQVQEELLRVLQQQGPAGVKLQLKLLQRCSFKGVTEERRRQI